MWPRGRYNKYAYFNMGTHKHIMRLRDLNKHTGRKKGKEGRKKGEKTGEKERKERGKQKNEIEPYKGLKK